MAHLNTMEVPTDFSAVPPAADREAVVREFLPSIKFHAAKLKLRLPPNIEMDDLVSSGIVGLLDALDRFDSSRGIKFKTYAEFRIRGTMLDYLREMDWFPRSARQSANRLQNSYSRLEAINGRPPEEERSPGTSTSRSTICASSLPSSRASPSFRWTSRRTRAAAPRRESTRSSPTRPRTRPGRKTSSGSSRSCSGRRSTCCPRRSSSSSPSITTTS